MGKFFNPFHGRQPNWLWQCAFLIAKAGMLLLLMMQPVQAAPISGEIERWGYSQSHREIFMQGWIRVDESTDSKPALQLHVAGQSHEVGNVAWTARSIPGGKKSDESEKQSFGFELIVRLPASLPSGRYPLDLEIKDNGGRRTHLLKADGSQPEFKVKSILNSHWRTFAIILLAIVGILLLGKRRWPRLERWVQGKGAVWTLFGAFAILVAIGVSGSSFGIMAQGPFGQSILQWKGEQKNLFGAKAIRGDEWGVLIPNSLAQVNHAPSFPIENDHIGLGGQNMGVIGMTGAPVLQWAALARPATWGYFVLPLRQAMSWQWQLPFWGGLLAVWMLLNCLRPQQRGLNLGLSLAFAVAPYAAAWSNWPLYATMYPAFAFVVATRIFTEHRKSHAALLGALLGWLMVCWFLVLYPAWLIVLASALGMLGAGWAIDNRERLRWGGAQWAAMLSAAVMAAWLLGSWWYDTRDAVALMKATVYPGGRGTLVGGDMSWWWHLRGYHNSESVLRSPGEVTNQSEASSYFYLPVLLVALLLTNLVRSSVVRWTLAGCALFMACYWWFNFIGVPVELAKYTMWGNMPTGRMEVGMGLVTVVVLALVARTGIKLETGVTAVKRVWPALVACASAWLVAAVLKYTPPELARPTSIVYTLAMMLPALFIAWWVLWGWAGAGVALLIVVNLISTLTFNPVGLAPRSVELAAEHRPFVSDPAHPERFLRTLVVNGDGIGPMTFSAVGIPIANGVFYYPHKEFWQKMGWPEEKWSVVNRYQHLGVYLSPWIAAEQGYEVRQEGVDQVHVHVDPRRFDFSRTGAERVAILEKDAPQVAGNPSLHLLGHANGMAWFSTNYEARH